MELLFLVKKFVGGMLMPFPLTILMLLVALYLFKNNLQLLAKKIFFVAISFFLFCATPITSQLLIKPIEHQFTKLELSTLPLEARNEIKYIWVMGCWHSDDESLPLVAKLGDCSLSRVVQASILWRQLPSVKIVFSGYEGKPNKLSDPEINKQLATAIGVPESSIILQIGTKDSHDEIQLMKAQTNGDKFILVSSASHLPRLKFLLEQQKLNPFLSPAEYVSSNGEFSLALFIPSSWALEQSERAIYEILGNIWVRLVSVFS